MCELKRKHKAHSSASPQLQARPPQMLMAVRMLTALQRKRTHIASASCLLLISNTVNLHMLYKSSINNYH